MDIKAQLNGRCDFIDVLSPRTRGADKIVLQFGVVEGYERGDLDHRLICCAVPARRLKRGRATYFLGVVMVSWQVQC